MTGIDDDGNTPDDHPDDHLALHYAEGTSIGYRGFDGGLAPVPLYWFAHGLG